MRRVDCINTNVNNHIPVVEYIMPIFNDLDYKTLVLKLCVKHPKIALELIKENPKLELTEQEKFLQEVVMGKYANSKIEAIKKHRELFGTGLKESKEEMDKIFDNNKSNWTNDSPKRWI